MGALLQLLVDQAVAQNRPGDQLREDGDVGGEVDEALGGFGVAPVDVDDVAQRLEHVEGNAQRQNDVFQGEGVDAQRLQHRHQHLGAEVGVLEVTQGGQVADDADAQQAEGDCLLAGIDTRLDAQAEPVVPVGNGDEQQEEIRAPPGIEQVAAEHDHVRTPVLACQVIAEQEHRQEEEQEDVGGEDHAGTTLGQYVRVMPRVSW